MREWGGLWGTGVPVIPGKGTVPTALTNAPQAGLQAQCGQAV